MTACQPIILGMTGASGADYGLRLLQYLLAAEYPVQLLLSKAAQIVIHMETELRLPGRAHDIQRVLTEYYGCHSGQLRVFGQDEWTAPPASGSARAQAMVVCPCTTGTLAAIANGNSDNLLERAADVSLKEGRKLILAVRETPLSIIHLENMLRLARTGAVILPTNPGFYHQPEHILDLVNFVVARILDQLDIPHQLLPRWGEPPEPNA
ncbi:MAG: aromatic acid decarboxylase [Candidatus Contendobacter odensis]|uniref:Flavin prenyltransferase UbiX n=1 Tax=Candidatus Contendibacter odensensis TaxID=1400860 RepID=A0A2G6PE97_9GAMM|nr:MAG: aromatic acid decarboxylase [Candidatus Contendobacter odensis]